MTGWTNIWDNRRTTFILLRFVAEKHLGECPLGKLGKWEDNLKIEYKGNRL